MPQSPADFMRISKFFSLLLYKLKPNNSSFFDNYTGHLLSSIERNGSGIFGFTRTVKTEGPPKDGP